MRSPLFMLAIAAAASLPLATAPAAADTVKVTALGSHDGEFCRADRAMLFEDPTGTTVLFDAGRTVAGPDDPRIGKLDVVLLSGVHKDHIGDKHMAAVNAGTCKKPAAKVSLAPNSLTATITAKKNAKLVVGGEMRNFLRPQVAAAGGSAKQVDVLRPGGKRKIGGVTIAIVTAVHSNGLSHDFLGEGMAGSMKADGITAYVGPESGYVLTFSNGLVVYLSGDTGHTADMATIVKGYYGAELAVMAIGDIYTMGPEEAAFAVNVLIQPKAVIPTHANEVATTGGKVNAGTKTATFTSLVQGIPVHPPLSGVTMEFDGDAKCVSGC
jgi:L-ascorbate metabolism protein UlaG (beta-lactamase superfamily)